MVRYAMVDITGVIIEIRGYPEELKPGMFNSEETSQANRKPFLLPVIDGNVPPGRRETGRTYQRVGNSVRETIEHEPIPPIEDSPATAEDLERVMLLHLGITQEQIDAVKKDRKLSDGNDIRTA